MPAYLTPGVYVEEAALSQRTIEGVSTSTVGFVGITEHIKDNDFDNDTLIDKPTLITSWRDFVKMFGRYNINRAPYLPPAVKGFFDNGGRRCFVVRVKDWATDRDYIGTDNGIGKKTGLQAFIEVDEINILCIPGMTSSAVQQAMITHCETMRDRFCILDSQKDANPNAIAAQRGKLFSAGGYGAIYYPWIKVLIEIKENDKIELIQDFVPPSGHIAGLYARTDCNRGVHKAPANVTVQGAMEIKGSIANGEQHILNPQGINCIRSFPGQGIRVWGARTLATDAKWRYVNVRRLFIFIEESIEEGTQWVVFEPNDEPTWARVRRSVSNFLTNVWRDGALQGSKPDLAFFVKCDRTTMTQTDIDNGKLIMEIGIAPVKPAEFVIFRIGQWTGGSEIEEL